MSRFQVPNTPKGVSSTRPPPPPIVEDPIDCPPPRVCPRCIQTPCFECRPSIEIDCPPEAEMFTPRIRALPPKKDIPKVVDSRCPPQKPCPPCRKVECPQCPPPFVCRNKVETFTFQIPKPPRGVSECPPCPPPTVCPPRVRGVDCPPQFCPPVECPECPPPRVCRPCPPPKVCPPPVVCPECPPQIDRCTLVQVKLLSTEFLSFNVPNLKVSWLMFNYPSGQQITYRIQVSRTELFGPRDTVSYIISPLPPQNNTLGDMNFANIQINRADMLLTGLSTYIPTYTRLQIVVDNLVTYSNIVTVSRLRLNSLNFRYLYGSDSITGTVSANLSMSNQTYALNLPIYIETVNSLHVITSQQLANVVSASNNESISSIDIVAPINIQLTRRDDRYRVYFVRDQGTPEEKKFYSNYLSPQIVN